MAQRSEHCDQLSVHQIQLKHGIHHVCNVLIVSDAETAGGCNSRRKTEIGLQQPK